jgi:class 3 adenylate cyclase
MDAHPTQLSQSDMPSTPEVALPDGTVTLLLTDVEGSTRLWESSAEVMAAAIDRHYVLLDAAIALHNGVRPVEQGEGDSVVAAFHSATDAIACGIDVQRAFAEEVWPEGRAVRVRMAIHTGEVLLRGSDNYFGPAIIRCARLRTLAHGGQILVSNTTRALVADSVSPETGFDDLGSHKLKDLDHPEQVWQLVHPDIEYDFSGASIPRRCVDEPPDRTLELRRTRGGGPQRRRPRRGEPPRDTHRRGRLRKDATRVRSRNARVRPVRRRSLVCRTGGGRER